ncbi:MAG: D-Ala-D-Ala carboxypeptidase family metallohydrolase [Fusobacteriaceae bacterium]
MKISNYFTEKETLVSATADAKGIRNILELKEHRENILFTAFRMDLIRTVVGTPLIVNSWFRSRKVNDAVGGSKTSSHMLGLAVDFVSKTMNPRQIKDKIITSGVSFDQLIEYDTFVHVGFKKDIGEERKQIMKK